MYLTKEQAAKILNDTKNSMAEGLIDKTEFMLSILKTDDWSMIIKAHALIETIVTELIIAQTEEEKLKSLIERLPLSDEQIGKLKITKDYNLLTSEQRTFVKRFSELRNMIVHKFENINFNLKEHINSLDKNKKKSWLKTITWYADDKDTREKWETISIEHPSIGLWFSTMMFISLTTIKIKELKSSTKIDKLAYETTKALLTDDV